MSSYETSSYDDDEKLVPEWGQSADNQIIWLGLLIAGLLGAMWFGLAQCGSTAADLAETVGVTAGVGDDSSVGALLAGTSGLGEADDYLADVDADLADADAGPYTVFAPVDAAFDGDIADLDGRAGYHVVEGRYKESALTAGTVLTTISGDKITVGDNGMLNGIASVIDADKRADNGIVHTISNVLGPQAAAPAPTAVPATAVPATATAVPEPTAVPAPAPTEVPEPTAVPPTEVPATATPVPEPTAVPAPDTQELVASLNELFILEPIQFAKNSAEILPESIPTLDNAVAVLSQAGADARVEVQGHTDSDGSAELNFNLSNERANSVLDYLISGGVSDDILSGKGYGETQLKIDPENSAEDKAENRRIEFVVLDQ